MCYRASLRSRFLTGIYSHIPTRGYARLLSHQLPTILFQEEEKEAQSEGAKYLGGIVRNLAAAKGLFSIAWFLRKGASISIRS
jgi:hypothetical protein